MGRADWSSGAEITTSFLSVGETRGTVHSSPHSPTTGDPGRAPLSWTTNAARCILAGCWSPAFCRSGIRPLRAKIHYVCLQIKEWAGGTLIQKAPGCFALVLTDWFDSGFRVRFIWSERLRASSERFERSPGTGTGGNGVMSEGHLAHHFLFVFAKKHRLQTVDLKQAEEARVSSVLWPNAERGDTAPSLSAQRFSRSGLSCHCPTALLPLHVSHLIKWPRVTLLLERSPMHYAGNTLPADGLEDAEPGVRSKCNLCRDKREWKLR